jgi:hypothetical protein
MFKKCVISKLSELLGKGGRENAIEKFKDVLAEAIVETVSEDSFYSLPKKEILTILKKSKIENVELLSSIVSQMINKMGEKSCSLLKVIDPKDATFEECISIISQFDKCPICRRIGQLHDDYKKLPDIDYEHENKELKREIEKLKKLNKKTRFPRVSKKPEDFESDIHKAAAEGKLKSVQYLAEQRIEAKDNNGKTPIIIASENDHLDVIKYLHEECHANVEAEDIVGWTPIMYASYNGHLEVVKYLYEECHVTITDAAILAAKNDEIKKYLQSKR